jgi:hypothetical protein
MDADEFVKVGRELGELGSRLTELRKAREDIDEEIKDLEEKARPLALRHAELVAEVVGKPVALTEAAEEVSSLPDSPPPSPPGSVATNGRGQPLKGPMTKNQRTALRNRITAYLDKCEPGTSAVDVAEALHLDVSVAREAMRDIMLSSS